MAKMRGFTNFFKNNILQWCITVVISKVGGWVAGRAADTLAGEFERENPGMCKVCGRSGCLIHMRGPYGEPIEKMEFVRLDRSGGDLCVSGWIDRSRRHWTHVYGEGGAIDTWVMSSAPRRN